MSSEFDDDLWARARSPQRKREIQQERLRVMMANLGRSVAEVVAAFAAIGQTDRNLRDAE